MRMRAPIWWPSIRAWISGERVRSIAFAVSSWMEVISFSRVSSCLRW